MKKSALRVLCTVYTKYPKVMTKHSVDGLLVSLTLFMQFSTCKLGIHGNKHVDIAILHPLTETLCLSSHCTTPESAIQKRKTLFLSNKNFMPIECKMTD